MIVFVMGPTGAGKTTFMDKVREMGHGTVEVGKMFRAKYPPEYFAGSAALVKTQQEAIDFMVTGIENCEAVGKKLIFVDGQPRDVSQVDYILRNYPNSMFVLLDCPTEVRLNRLVGRDGSDEAKLALAKARLEGDYITMFPVISRLLSYGEEIHSIDTSTDDAIDCLLDMWFWYEEGR